MSQKRITLQLSEDQKQELADFIKNPPAERLGIRASMVLDSASGMKVAEVAAKYDERPSTVSLWKRRYAEEGLDGLLNRARGKSKDGYGPDFTERLAAAVHGAPPDGEQRWTIELLAKHFGVPEYGIRRHLKKAGIYLNAEAFFEEHLNNAPENGSNEAKDHPATKESAADDPSQLPENTEPTSSADVTDTAAKSNKLHSRLVHILEDEDGNVVQMMEADAGLVPDKYSFNMESVEGFRSDYSMFEQGMINAFVRLLGNSSATFLAGVSAENLKKNKM